MLVRRVLVQHEPVRERLILAVSNGRVTKALECVQAASCLRKALVIMNGRRLRAHLAHRLIQCVALEELLARLRGVSELNVVVLGCVEELLEVAVAVIVVLRLLHVEVGVPAQLTEHISILGDLGVVRDAGTLDLVVLVGVELPAWWVRNISLSSEGLIEVFLHTAMDLIRFLTR